MLARLVKRCEEVMSVLASTSIRAKSRYLQPLALITEIKPCPAPLQESHVVYTRHIIT